MGLGCFDFLTFSVPHPKYEAARQMGWRAAGDDGGNDRYCRVLPGVSWAPLDASIWELVSCVNYLLCCVMR